MTSDTFKIGLNTYEATPENLEILRTFQAYCQDRFKTGRWQPIPGIEPYQAENTFPHMSLQSSSSIAFFPDIEHAKRGTPIVVKPGRYYSKYNPSLTADVISKLTTWARGYTVKFATKPIEIVSAYMGGVSSCMSHPFPHLPCHPSAVYGNSKEFAVAYIENSKGRVTGRGVVDTQAKTYWRTYGEGIEKELQSIGYKMGSPAIGSKMNLIPIPGAIGASVRTATTTHRYPIIVLPYTDFVRQSDKVGQAMAYESEKAVEYSDKLSVLYFGSDVGIGTPYCVCTVCRKSMGDGVYIELGDHRYAHQQCAPVNRRTEEFQVILQHNPGALKQATQGPLPAPGHTPIPGWL